MYDRLELDDGVDTLDRLELDDGVAAGVYDLFDDEELGVYELLERAEPEDTPLVVRLGELDVLAEFVALDELRAPDAGLSLYTCRLPLLGLLYTCVLLLGVEFAPSE